MQTVKLTNPWSTTNEKLGGQVKNMGAPKKLFNITILKSEKFCEFSDW